MSTAAIPPRHRRPTRLRALMRGFDSLTIDPSPRLKLLRAEIETSNTVAEAWTQTGQMLAAAMSHSPASTRNSSR